MVQLLSARCGIRRCNGIDVAGGLLVVAVVALVAASVAVNPRQPEKGASSARND